MGDATWRVRPILLAIVCFAILFAPEVCWAHGAASHNTNTSGWLKLDAYAQIGSPAHGAVFVTTDTITFSAHEDTRVVLTNLESVAHSVTYNWEIELDAGLQGGIPGVLDADGEAEVTWNAPASGTRTHYGILADQWAGTAAASYFALVVSSVWDLNMFTASTYHQHDFTVNNP